MIHKCIALACRHFFVRGFDRRADHGQDRMIVGSPRNGLPGQLGSTLALCLSLAATGCGEVQTAVDKAAIEGVLHDTGLTGTAHSDEHVSALKGIDISHCPQDFRDGYIRYIHAWEEEAAVQKAKAQIDAEQDPAAMAAVLATVFDAAATPWADHLEAENKLATYQKQADADLDEAARGLNDLARRHGVNIMA